MSKSSYILILITALTISCTPKKENSINLFNDIRFGLQQGEELVDIKLMSTSYLDQTNQKKIQVPLFKCIKNSNYIMYIGIPYNTSLSALSKSELFEKNLPIQANTDSTTFDYKQYLHDATYITEYAVKVQNNLLYVIAVSKSKAIQDSLFNFKVLSHRLIIPTHDIKK